MKKFSLCTFKNLRFLWRKYFITWKFFHITSFKSATLVNHTKNYMKRIFPSLKIFFCRHRRQTIESTHWQSLYIRIVGIYRRQRTKEHFYLAGLNSCSGSSWAISCSFSIISAASYSLHSTIYTIYHYNTKIDQSNFKKYKTHLVLSLKTGAIEVWPSKNSSKCLNSLSASTARARGMLTLSADEGSGFLWKCFTPKSGEDSYPQCCGSVTFWYGSGSADLYTNGSCYFRQWPSRWQLKIICLLLFKLHLHHFSNIKA